MSIRKMTEVWDSEEPQHGVLLVLLALADWANDDGICWPSIPSIARRSRLSERHVYRILRGLAEDGRLSVETGKGRGNTSRYKLNLSRCQASGSKNPDIGSTETLTSDAVKPDIQDTPIRKEPSGTINEPSTPSARSAAGKTDPRFTPFVEAIDKYWKFKNPNLGFHLGNAGGNELKRFLGNHPSMTLDQFRVCLNHRARSDMVHSQDVCRWIGRTQEFLDGPLDQYWKPKQVKNGNGTSKTEQLRNDNREAIVRLALEPGFRGGHGHNRPAVEVGAVPEARRREPAGAAAADVAGQPRAAKPGADA